jgi:hypothetical protein
MNYNTIAEMIDAGITNATTIFDGNNDDTTYNIAIPSWVKFNGKTTSKLYYSGNSWIGFENSDQICYNRRDARMYKAYLEEGTILGIHQFIRYRFNGLTTYSGSFEFEWEIFFFDTGDIMIHLITMHDTVDGLFYVRGAKQYDYISPTVENPYVTFYSQDEKNSTFSVDYDIIELHKLQYLVEDTDNVIYTVENGNIVPIDVETLTASVFKEYGCSRAEVNTVLMQIPNVKVYAWCEYGVEHLDKYRTVEVSAIPYNQVVYSDNLYRPQVGTYVTVLGIENVSVKYEGAPLIAMSFDAGETWNAYKNKQWVSLEQTFSGNTPDEIESISTPVWNMKFDISRQIKFRFTLTEGDSITNITVHYLNPAE